MIVPLGQTEFAELLINHGANISVADENHNTALHYAVNAGKVSLKCFLKSLAILRFKKKKKIAQVVINKFQLKPSIQWHRIYGFEGAS